MQGNHCNQPWTGVISHPHHSGSLGHLGIKSNACLPPIFGAAPMRSNRTTPKVFNTTVSLCFAKGYHRTTNTALVTIVMCRKIFPRGQRILSQISQFTVLHTFQNQLSALDISDVGQECAIKCLNLRLWRDMLQLVQAEDMWVLSLFDLIFPAFL